MFVLLGICIAVVNALTIERSSVDIDLQQAYPIKKIELVFNDVQETDKEYVHYYRLTEAVSGIKVINDETKEELSFELLQSEKYNEIHIPLTSKTSVIVISYTIINTMVNRPKKIKQYEMNEVDLDIEICPISAVEIESCGTTMSHSSSLKFITDPFTKERKDSNTVFSDILAIKPFEEKRVVVHYSPKVHLKVEKYIHTIDIPIIDNALKIENLFEGMVNEGAELADGFSRYEFQGNQILYPQAVLGLNLHVNKDAYHWNYRDTSGNISTSAVEHKGNQIDLTLLPRYPLLTNWKTEFNINYHIPKNIFTTPGKTMIELPIVEDTVVENCIVRVYIPDGATFERFDSGNNKIEKVEINDHEAFLSFAERKEVLIYMKHINLMEKNTFAIYYTESSASVTSTYLLALLYLIIFFIGFFFFIKYSA